MRLKCVRVTEEGLCVCLWMCVCACVHRSTEREHVTHAGGYVVEKASFDAWNGDLVERDAGRGTDCLWKQD